MFQCVNRAMEIDGFWITFMLKRQKSKWMLLKIFLICCTHIGTTIISLNFYLRFKLSTHRKNVQRGQ